MDVDLATPLEFVAPCLARLEAGADVVIGSRRLAAAQIEQHQAPLREFLGRGFSLLSRTISGVRVSDFTCGFKGFSAEAADAIFSRLRLDDWSFDTELLFLAKALGLRIDELPVRWRDDARTKVRLGRDIVELAFGPGGHSHEPAGGPIQSAVMTEGLGRRMLAAWRPALIVLAVLVAAAWGTATGTARDRSGLSSRRHVDSSAVCAQRRRGPGLFVQSRRVELGLERAAVDAGARAAAGAGLSGRLPRRKCLASLWSPSRRCPPPSLRVA